MAREGAMYPVGSSNNSLGTYLKSAVNPLQQAINMFKGGGGYGAGQNALIEEQAKKDKAEALANQVASGISSGSLATGTGLNINKGMTTQKLGVEDTRTQFLNQALQALSGLYGQFGGLNLQRELGMAGLEQNRQASEMDALSKVASAKAGNTQPTWSQTITPMAPAWWNAPSNNSGYNSPQF